MNRLLFYVPFGLSLAFSQLFGLFDPAFTLDPALERQFFVHGSHICFGPCRHLGKGGYTRFKQLLLKCGANARQPLEIIATRCRLGAGFLGGLRFDHSRNRAGTDSRFDACCVCTAGQNLGDTQQRQLLTMATGALRAVLTATFDKVDNLVTLDLINDLGLNGRTDHKGRTDDGGIATEHQDIVELNFFTSISCKFLNTKNVARRHLVLLATGLEDRKHGLFLFSPRSVVPG
ncbi:hypothetical protein RV134_350334 [Roseovarius sp. EC-HK134]|nr:hypothetical protein RV134_350334 [Roseovarius sp. EC-HK134]